MKLRFSHLRVYLLLLLLIALLLSCDSVKPVVFENPIDTTGKPIQIQERKIFEIIEKGLFATNNFDAARLNDFRLENDSTALVFIKPENVPINDSPYYAFKLWSEKPQFFYFKFIYPKGFKHRYYPKLKIDNVWKLIDSANILKAVDSNVVIKLFLTKSPTTVAAQKIQSSTHVLKWYSDLIDRKQGIVKLNSYGRSKLGRNLPVLDIGYGNAKHKKTVVLLTRQHPPEVTGYFAFQNFLETILNESELSKQFLSKFRILAFPIMNPDGVDLGHWRHNAAGVDLNRDWSVYNQPEIRLAVKYINKQLKNNQSELVMGLDFHSTWYDVFYTNKERKFTKMPTFIDDWFSAIEMNYVGYRVNEKSSVSKKPTSKAWFLNAHQAVGITFEIGDDTIYEKIKRIGAVSAEQMMNILLDYEF